MIANHYKTYKCNRGHTFKAVVTSSYARVKCPKCEELKDETNYFVPGYNYTATASNPYNYDPSSSSYASNSSDSYSSGGSGDFGGGGASGSWE